MSIGIIGVTQGHRVASNIERLANKSGHNTLTSVKHGRYIIRTDNNDGTYVKTCLEMDGRGVVKRAYSTLMRNSGKLKQKIMDFLR